MLSGSFSLGSDSIGVSIIGTLRKTPCYTRVGKTYTFYDLRIDIIPDDFLEGPLCHYCHFNVYGFCIAPYIQRYKGGPICRSTVPTVQFIWNRLMPHVATELVKDTSDSYFGNDLHFLLSTSFHFTSKSLKDTSEKQGIFHIL